MSLRSGGLSPVLHRWRRPWTILEGGSQGSVSGDCVLHPSARKRFPGRTYSASKPLSTFANALQAAKAHDRTQDPVSIPVSVTGPGRGRNGSQSSEPTKTHGFKSKDARMLVDEDGVGSQESMNASTAGDESNAGPASSRRSRRAYAGVPDSGKTVSLRTDIEKVESAPTALFPIVTRPESKGPPMPRPFVSERVKTWLKDMGEEEDTDDARYGISNMNIGSDTRGDMDTTLLRRVDESMARRINRPDRDRSRSQSRPLKIDVYSRTLSETGGNVAPRFPEPHRGVQAFKQQYLEEEVKRRASSESKPLWYQSQFYKSSRRTEDEGPSFIRPRATPYTPFPTDTSDTADALAVYDYTRVRPTPRLVYARDATHANAELSTLLAVAAKPWGARVAGLDCEWRPNFTAGEPERPVAVVQIALGSTILLLQVSAMTEFPSMLREFLAEPTILKAGVGIQDDCKKLFKNYEVSTRGCVELSYLSRSLDAEYWHPGIGADAGVQRVLISLARLVRAYERRSLSKKTRVRISNWEAVLRAEQQEYAANDAHVAMSLAVGLLSRAPPELDHGLFTFDVVDGAAKHLDGTPWVTNPPKKAKGPKPQKEEPAKVSSISSPESMSDSDAEQPS